MDAYKVGSSTSIHIAPEPILSVQRGIYDDEQWVFSKRKKLRFDDEMELDVSMKSVGVSPGDVNSLLSIISDMRHLPRNIGGLVDVDRKTLWVKNVVFVCLYMPADFDLEPEPFYPIDLIHTCSELYLYRDDFEVVLVSKMNDNFHNSEFLFKESLFPFPHSSLVVPFNNHDGCNYVCDLLKLRDPGNKCLYVNASKGILHHGEPDSMVHHLKGLLEKSSFDAQHSRERLLNSMWPVKSQDLKLTSSLAPCPIARILEREKPKYSDDITKMVSDSESYPIEIHKSLDVKFMLSRGMCESYTLVRNNGEKVQVDRAFRDKYIMVCSFYVPIFREYMEAKYVQSLSTVCSELYAKRMDFEMVVVAKMNTLADDKMVFDRFLSGFCSSCFVYLLIPNNLTTLDAA